MFVYRTGKAGTLILRRENDLGIVEEEEAIGEAQGTFTVLELDVETSKFYVGGVPYSANVNIPKLLCSLKHFTSFILVIHN